MAKCIEGLETLVLLCSRNSFNFELFQNQEYGVDDAYESYRRNILREPATEMLSSVILDEHRTKEADYLLEEIYSDLRGHILGDNSKSCEKCLRNYAEILMKYALEKVDVRDYLIQNLAENNCAGVTLVRTAKPLYEVMLGIDASFLGIFSSD